MLKNNRTNKRMIIAPTIEEKIIKALVFFCISTPEKKPYIPELLQSAPNKGKRQKSRYLLSCVYVY